MKVLTNVGLDGLEDRRLNEISSGQKQKLAIAIVLVSGEPLLVDFS